MGRAEELAKQIANLLSPEEAEAAPLKGVAKEAYQASVKAGGKRLWHVTDPKTAENLVKGGLENPRARNAEWELWKPKGMYFAPTLHEAALLSPEGVEVYGNISSQKLPGDDATSYKIGSVLPMGDYSLFVEYKGDVDGPEYNNLLLGASYRHVFVAAPVDFDLTYTNTDDFSGEAKNMVITASSRHKLTTDFDLLASVNRGVFFSSFTKVNAGLCYHGTKGLQIEAATSVDPVSKSNPEYGDFNFSLSLSMFI